MLSLHQNFLPNFLLYGQVKMRQRCENEGMPDVEQYVNNLFQDNFFLDNKFLDDCEKINWRYS